MGRGMGVLKNEQMFEWSAVLTLKCSGSEGKNPLSGTSVDVAGLVASRSVVVVITPKLRDGIIRCHVRKDASCKLLTGRSKLLGCGPMPAC